MADRSVRSLCGSRELLEAFGDVEMTCLDVGARGGIITDLLPLASVINAVGFEPDPAECDRLNAQTHAATDGWRSLRFLPRALGAASGTQVLHLYSHVAASSLYEADTELARRFSRDDYFSPRGDVEVRVTTMDQVAREYGLTDVAYAKLDVQGAELDVLRGAPDLLRTSLVALRVEVEFVPQYRGQPLFSEVEMHLRALGFEAVDFVDMHEWRLTTKTKHPRLARGVLPYSRGHLSHGDVLFLKRPVEAERDGGERALLRLALLALAYEQLDLAESILGRRAFADRWGRAAATCHEVLERLSLAASARHDAAQGAEQRRIRQANRRVRLERHRWFRRLLHLARKARGLDRSPVAAST